MQAKKEFIQIFDTLSQTRHRYEVFRDFVICASASLHNAAVHSEVLESRYMEAIHRYPKEETLLFPKLFTQLVDILNTHPHDALGQLYMELDLGSEHMGQYFTPSEISKLMAKLQGAAARLENQQYITLHDPASGAGGMILAVADDLIQAGYDPAQKMWAQCIDIDRTAAMMCYIQLALWNIPAQVIVGNTLSMTQEEVYYTPAHYMHRWEERLRKDWEEPLSPSPQVTDLSDTSDDASRVPDAMSPSPKRGKVDQIGFDFDI